VGDFLTFRYHAVMSLAQYNQLLQYVFIHVISVYFCANSAISVFLGHYI